MKSARIIALCAFALGIALNQWAFRLIFPPTPVDAFIRLMMLVLDGFLLTIILAFAWRNIPFAERLKQLLQQWPRLVSLFMSLLFAYGTLMAVEISSRLCFKYVYHD
nr:hypothetical protein [Flavobacteriales bacterium]